MGVTCPLPWLAVFSLPLGTGFGSPACAAWWETARPVEADGEQVVLEEGTARADPGLPPGSGHSCTSARGAGLPSLAVRRLDRRLWGIPALWGRC